jgi:acetyl esterase/lipase
MRFIGLFLCLSTLFCVGCTNGADDQEWAIEVRNVPVPAGASEALQDAIRDSAKPDVSSKLDVPQTEAEWLERYGELDEANGIRNMRMAEEFEVSVDHDVISGVKVSRILPAVLSPANRNRLFVYLHGGAYVFGSGDAGIHEAILIASRLGIPVLSIDYRMPPIHPFPAALEDVVAVYETLLLSRSAGTMAIGGSSAGGGLALATVHQLRSLDIQPPGVVYAGAAWADLTLTGDSLFHNEGLDRLLVTYNGRLGASARLYAGDHNMMDPLLSPVYGDFEGFPPTILISGTRDLFLSHVARTHRKLRAAGVVADLHVYEGLSHAGYVTVFGSPESIDVYHEINAFISRHLD